MGQFKNFITEQVLLESGFSRIASIMSGLVPSVRTFAILTAENPMNTQLSEKENRERNEKLKKQLIDGAYGFTQIKGKYDKFENPFFIMNIAKSAAIKLGKDWKQESILFGTVKKEFDIVFELIYCFEDKVLQRHVWKSYEYTDKPKMDFGGSNAQQKDRKRGLGGNKKEDEKENYYSEFKGGKFVVPFFDDTYETAKFDKGTIVKEGHNIYFSKDFSPAIINDVEEIINDVDILNENVSGKHKWLYRGYAFSILHKNVRN
jgi:hypothetical protein